MTKGSSQGLFVIVAVVIFGIFVAISYSLFRDNLTPSLANIFSESTSIAFKELYEFKNIQNIRSPYVHMDKIGENHYRLYNLSFAENTNERYPTGLRIDENIEVPWNHKLIIRYDIKFKGDTPLTASLDFNAFPKGKYAEESWNGNDNFGRTSFTGKTSMYAIQELKPNVWNSIEVWYANNHSGNKNKETITEGSTVKDNTGSVLGIQSSGIKLSNVKEFEMRNLKYKVVPI